jgi:hypothetical protein
MVENSIAEIAAASEEGFNSMELVNPRDKAFQFNPGISEGS